MADDHGVGAGGRRAVPPRLTIDSHRLLAARRKAVIDALVTDPARGRLLFANASLAFKDAGVDLSPDIADHVLHSVRQSAAATTRRERLTAQLKEALGVVPHPSDPSWLATTLFERLGLSPLATKGQDAVYQPAIPAEVEGRLRAHLPPASRPRLPARGTTAAPRTTPWRLDLDASVPVLPNARRAPKAVTLDDLWFYLDVHELVRPLLELGILEVSVLPTLTRSQYEAVKAGRPTGGFLDWVDAVNFPEERIRPPRAVKTVPATKAAATKAAATKAAATKAEPAKKAAAKNAVPATKAAPAKKAAEKKAVPATKAVPARKAAGTKAVPAKKAAPARKTAGKKASPAPKAAPAKKTTTKAATTKAAPAKRTTVKKVAPAAKRAAKKTTARRPRQP